MSELQSLALIGAGVLAGIGWSLIGWWNQYKSNGEKNIDLVKVRKNVVVGTVLGIIAWGLALSGQVAITPITGSESFVNAVIAMFPLIVLADKLITRKAEKF